MSNEDKTQPYSHEVDLELITGSPIVRVVGYVTNEFGDLTFKATRVITAAGDSYGIEGEHDLPYVIDLDAGKLEAHYKD